MLDTTFIEELASAAPTPGGGGASAYCGALASSLASMVGNLTVGKKTYAAVEDQVQEALAELETLRARLIDLVDQDAQAFAPLAAAYRMPKETEEQQAAKHEALQQALVGACDVPLGIIETISEVIRVTDFLAHNGSRMARSDAGVAAAFARAASDGASLNVYINIASMADAELAKNYRERTDELVSRNRCACDEIFDFVLDAVS